MLAGILLTAVLSRTAIADPEASEVHPVKPFSVAAQYVMRAAALDGVSESGGGPTIELALGSGRTQYFLEGGLGWMSYGVEPYETGFMVRGGVGARYIARSFQFGDGGAVEMTLDGLVGVERTRLDDDTIVRPEFALGVGLQARVFDNPRFLIRFSLRVFFAPTGNDRMLAARGTEPSVPLTNGGLMFGVGGGW